MFVGASADGGGMPELRRDSYTGLGEGLSSKIVEVRVVEVEAFIGWKRWDSRSYETRSLVSACGSPSSTWLVKNGSGRVTGKAKEGAEEVCGCATGSPL